MKKCERYPDCDCFKDWEKPAKEIDPSNAEMFVTIKQEMENYLDNVEWVTYEPLIEMINEKLDLLPEGLQLLFIGKIFPFIEFHYLWKMPEKSNLLKLRKALLARLSAKNELNFYTDKKNIANTELVQDTIKYFETGEGSRAFKALEFLNLLWQQYNFINSNIEEPEFLFSALNSLPLSELERHILYGFIIRWYGGYPLEAPLGVGNSEQHYQFRKLLLKKFLSYEDETPEKEFCKADFEQRKEFMKLGIALTTAINNNMDVTQIYNSMQERNPKERGYSNFDQLFKDAVQNKALGEFTDKQVHLIERSRYNFEFNVWLQETKGWENGNNVQYIQLLTKDNFKEFLHHQKYIEAQRKKLLEDEKQSWQIKKSGKDEKDVIKLITERTELNDFLSVPAPDITHKNAFWYDENDLPIDCNIYHPKYGYPGFETTTKDVVVTSFQPVTIYKDNETGKTIYCQYCWEMLCTVDEINFTNKDGKKVRKVDFIQTHLARRAENELDFEFIYKREFEKKEVNDAPENRKVFCQELTSHIQELIQQHKNKSTYKDGIDINVLGKANEFISWLNNKKKTSLSTLPTLEQIFDPAKSGHIICLDLFKELQIIDSITGNKEITEGKGYLLFGLIDAIKESSHNLLNKTYTDDKLLSIFNAHLQTEFKQLKRTSQGFKDAKKQSKDFINKQIKVAPST